MLQHMNKKIFILLRSLCFFYLYGRSFWAHLSTDIVMFPMAKKYVFPNFKEKIPNSGNKKDITIL